MNGTYRPKYRNKRTGEVKESAVWWIYYSRGGKVFYESSRSKLITDAKRLLASRRGAIADGKQIAPKSDRILIDELLQDVIQDYEVNKKKSLRSVEIRHKKSILPFFTGRRATSITASDLQSYILARRKELVSNATINRELAFLRRAFSLARQRGKILYGPHFEMLKESAPRSGFFEPETFETLCSHLPEDVAPSIRFAMETGWRVPSEVLRLEWRNVDFNSEKVTLDAGTTKNDEPRMFPFTKTLREILEEQRTRTDELQRKRGTIIRRVFHHEGKTLVDPSGKPTYYFRDAWKAACEKAKVAGMLCHDLRRSAVRNFSNSGITEQIGMKLAGHKTPSIYRRYRIVTETDLRNAVKKLENKTFKVPLKSAQEK